MTDSAANQTGGDLAPLYAGVLIGGASRRMGRPKHLLRTAPREPLDSNGAHEPGGVSESDSRSASDGARASKNTPNGSTWIERTVATLAPHAERVFILGAGELPAALADLPRLVDAPETRGPLAGILAALRHAPQAAWLVAACDLPDISPAAVAWLLAQRSPQRVAILPTIDGRPEPVLAIYEPAARAALEELARAPDPAPRRLASCDGVYTPVPPARLCAAWRNVNTPAELGRLRRPGGGP